VRTIFPGKQRVLHDQRAWPQRRPTHRTISKLTHIASAAPNERTTARMMFSRIPMAARDWDKKRALNKIFKGGSPGMALRSPVTRAAQFKIRPRGGGQCSVNLFGGNGIVAERRPLK
jgi:hypothetical protein